MVSQRHFMVFVKLTIKVAHSKDLNALCSSLSRQLVVTRAKAVPNPE